VAGEALDELAPGADPGTGAGAVPLDAAQGRVEVGAPGGASRSWAGDHSAGVAGSSSQATWIGQLFGSARLTAWRVRPEHAEPVRPER